MPVGRLAHFCDLPSLLSLFDVSEVSATVQPWERAETILTRLSRGWWGYFSPGSHYASDRLIETPLYDRVRNVLVQRHKMHPRSIGPFTKEAVFGTLGIPRLRHCRRTGVIS